MKGSIDIKNMYEWPILSSNKQDIYYIRFVNDKWSCTCPGNTKGKKICKHIRKIKEIYFQIEQAKVFVKHNKDISIIIKLET